MAPRVGLVDYFFTSFEVRWLQESGGVEQMPPEVQIRERVEEEAWFVKLALRLRPVPGKSGYEVDLTIVGAFQIEQSSDEGPDGGKIGYLAALNGSTILYGIVRGELTSLTSSFPGGRYLLPAVYMNEVLKAQGEKQGEERTTQQP